MWGSLSNSHAHQKSCSYFVGVYFFSFLVLILSLSFKFIQKSDSLLAASFGLPILSHAHTLTCVQFILTHTILPVTVYICLSTSLPFTHTHTMSVLAHYGCTLLCQPGETQLVSWDLCADSPPWIWLQPQSPAAQTLPRH